MLLLVNQQVTPTGVANEEKAMKRVATFTPFATKLKRLTALAGAAAAFASIGASAPAASAYSTPPPKDGCTMTVGPTQGSANCTIFGAPAVPVGR